MKEITWFERLLARWRIWWNLCPACNSDAPEIYTCWCCGGNRIFPLTVELKNHYRRAFGLKAQKQEVPRG